MKEKQQQRYIIIKRMQVEFKQTDLGLRCFSYYKCTIHRSFKSSLKHVLGYIIFYVCVSITVRFSYKKGDRSMYV
jgi:hypothetical protein